VSVNRKQRRLVYSYTGLGAVLAPLVVFDDWITAHAVGFRYLLLLVALPIALLLAPRNPQPVDFEEIADGHGWIKIWMVLCCVAILVLYYVTTHTSLRLEHTFRVLVIAIFVTVAPLIGVAFWRRYKAYGEESDAI
jgi:hypothetical protein